MLPSVELQPSSNTHLRTPQVETITHARKHRWHMSGQAGVYCVCTCVCNTRLHSYFWAASLCGVDAWVFNHFWIQLSIWFCPSPCLTQWLHLFVWITSLSCTLFSWKELPEGSQHSTLSNCWKLICVCVLSSLGCPGVCSIKGPAGSALHSEQFRPSQLCGTCIWKERKMFYISLTKQGSPMLFFFIFKSQLPAALIILPPVSTVFCVL